MPKDKIKIQTVPYKLTMFSGPFGAMQYNLNIK